jgi:hypothetical protein
VRASSSRMAWSTGYCSRPTSPPIAPRDARTRSGYSGVPTAPPDAPDDVTG